MDLTCDDLLSTASIVSCTLMLCWYINMCIYLLSYVYLEIYRRRYMYVYIIYSIYMHMFVRIYSSIDGLKRLSCQRGRPRISVCERITSIHNPIIVTYPWKSYINPPGCFIRMCNQAQSCTMFQYVSIKFEEMNIMYDAHTCLRVLLQILVPCLVVWSTSSCQPSIKHHHNHFGWPSINTLGNHQLTSISTTVH